MGINKTFVLLDKIKRIVDNKFVLILCSYIKNFGCLKYKKIYFLKIKINLYKYSYGVSCNLLMFRISYLLFMHLR